jgi:Tfp pilus assembly protein PilX
MKRHFALLSPPKQRGVALAICLIMLLLLTIIGITAMRSSIFETRMARNEESRIRAFERAQSIIDSVISNVSNLQGAEIGNTFCTTNMTGCTNTGVKLSSDLTTGLYGARSKAKVTFSSCMDDVPRRLNVSEDEFDSANFMVESEYNAIADQQGRSAIAQGVLVIIRQGPQSACP